jgi:Tfp pilus assembly protein PilF
MSSQSHDDALARLDEAIRRSPQNADLYVLKARALLAEDWVDDALVELDVAIALAGGQSFLAYQARGEARERKGDVPGAIEDYERAASREPNHPAVLRRLGICQARLRQYAEALRCFDRCLQALPQDAKADRARVLTDRAAILAALQDWEAALRDVSEAVNLDARLGEPHAIAGDVYCELQDWIKAARAFSAALKCEERLYWVYRRAEALCEAGELEAAVQDCDLIIEKTKGKDELSQALRARALAELAARGRTEFAAVDKSPPQRTAGEKPQTLTSLYSYIKLHFSPCPIANLFINQRLFPMPARADLQIALEAWLRQAKVLYFCGRAYSSLPELLTRKSPFAVDPQPPQYDDWYLGEAEPARCLRGGLWLLDVSGSRLLLLLAIENGRVAFQVAAPLGENGRRVVADFFGQLKEGVQRSPTLRGKVISFGGGNRYAGELTPLTIHELPSVSREELILPAETLAMLESNVLDFCRQRKELVSRGLPAKKRLLFFGPAGTGKTHAIHYLITALKAAGEPCTTLVIPPLQTNLAPDYLELAKLLQPSVVVVENIELASGTDLLELLQANQATPPESEILLILTATKPASARRDLAVVVEQVDQVIEFPLPDDDDCARLVRLFAGGSPLDEDLVAEVVAHASDKSPAYLKELLRRALQYQLSRDAADALRWEDVRNASDELLLHEDLLGGRDVGFKPT